MTIPSLDKIEPAGPEVHVAPARDGDNAAKRPAAPQGSAPGRQLLAWTLTRYGLVVAVILALIGGALQIVADFGREIQRGDAIVSQIMEAANASLTDAAFQRDREQAPLALHGVVAYGFIKSATMYDDLGTQLGSFQREPPEDTRHLVTALITEPFPVVTRDLIHPRTGWKVGWVRIVVDRAVLLDEFFSRSISLIVISVGRHLLLALVLLWIFHRALTRPLAEFADILRTVDAREPKALDLPDSVTRPNNEISEIAETTNSVIGASAEYLKQRIEAEAQREEIERQLAHSDKLRVVGQLTGGIAHDFNNLLAIMMGNAELAKGEARNEEVKEYITEVVDATQRASDLTRQLLAYSRKQPLTPAPIIVRSLLSDLEQLLRRTLGERIELEVVSGGGLWQCFADEQKLGTVLLNLAINARDAMPDGGKLVIEAYNARLDADYANRDADVKPGQYVCIVCTDSGTGIPRENIEKVFEPFFTTKPVGQGSGLGLSMAYGFVKQSDGHMEIDSEMGIGTAIKIYLPRYLKQAVPPVKTSASEARPQSFAGLRVLLVEDDDSVRRTVRTQLESLGCTVQAARDAADALLVWDREKGAFDLFLLDVVLPGSRNGPQLAEEFRSRQPETPVVFMSGYTENALVGTPGEGPGEVLVQKPFSRQQLNVQLKRALGR